MALTREQLRARVDAIRWYHSIDLGDGVVTPGLHPTREHMRTIGLPRDLAGRTVLDVGSWDGAFAFECERRGAGRVLATDHFCWGGEGWGTKAGFDLARSVLGSHVEERELDVLDLTPESVGAFDVVLCLGALPHASSVPRARADGGDHGPDAHSRDRGRSDRSRPSGDRLLPGKRAGNDPTNWHGPNPAAVDGMLRALGFTRIACVVPPSVDDRGDPLIEPLDRLGAVTRACAGQEVTRMTFHATRA